MFSNQPVPIQNLNYVLGFVHGKAGVDAFFVPTNFAAILFDLDGQQFYLKQTDQYGVAFPIKEFKYSEIQRSSAIPETSNEYMTRADVEAIVKEIVGGKKDEPDA